VPLLLNFTSKFQPTDGILRFFYKIYPYLHQEMAEEDGDERAGGE
jgi:hypothetical protein